MNEQLESIIDRNYMSKQSIDLAMNYIDVVQSLSKDDRETAIISLFNQNGLSNLYEVLSKVSQSINDIDGELSDMIEGASHE